MEPLGGEWTLQSINADVAIPSIELGFSVFLARAVVQEALAAEVEDLPGDGGVGETWPLEAYRILAVPPKMVSELTIEFSPRNDGS